MNGTSPSFWYVVGQMLRLEEAWLSLGNRKWPKNTNLCQTIVGN